MGVGGKAGRASYVILVAEIHKRPFRARFVANSSSCTTAVLSKLLASCLTAVKKHWIGYYDTVYERDGIDYFCQLKILVMFSVGLSLGTSGLLDCLRVVFLRCVITKTCLYSLDPLEPHFYIVKLGLQGYTLFFLILLKT